MGILEERIRELDRLEEEYRREKERIERAIAEAVRGIGQNPEVKPLGKNMFTISFSELSGAPWSPQFHDWTRQAELLLDVLHKHPIRKWSFFIRELLERKPRNGWRGITVDKTVLSRKFLQQVAARL